MSMSQAFGDCARPFSIYAMGAACAAATIGCLFHPDQAANFVGPIGAAGAVLAALYGAKSYETATQAKATAEVDKAKAAASGGTQPVS
jgi:hypothetical protein